MPANHSFQHPTFDRRSVLQAGAVGILGLGMNHWRALRAESVESKDSPAKAVIFIFLSGGLSQLDSFDLKPDAPSGVRGEFRPIATSTPGVQICEHLPHLAARSNRYALVRSLTHSSNDHSAGHHIMLTGRSDLPPGFSPNQPKPTDWPCMASVAGAVTTPRNNLPPAAVLPERLIHNTGRIIPGQFAGIMGSRRDPWFIEAAPTDAKGYGAWPGYAFHHANGKIDRNQFRFQAPNLSLVDGLSQPRLNDRMSLLAQVEHQRRNLEHTAQEERFDLQRQAAVSLLCDSRVRQAFDVTKGDSKTLDRYGRNSFGWSLLMARRLVEAGVNFVQVNLGNDETWDTHGNIFPNLKDYLFPPTDLAVSALLDDLHESGQLQQTLVVMAGEFGRTPRISSLPQHYKLPGRDHWGAVQSVLLAGGGVQGGRVIGSSDKNGGFPATEPQTPENLAATIYQSLGIPKTAAWREATDRPHFVYTGEPIRGLS
jgi:hypothetical protein